MATMKTIADFARELSEGVCGRCGKPVDDESVVVFRTRRGDQDHYPDHDLQSGEPIVFVAHEDCAPDFGYALFLHQLSGRDPDLVEHLENKPWWCPEYRVGFAAAQRVANRLIKPNAIETHTIDIADGIGGVYFVEAAKRVKIGYARDVRSRLGELKTGCPVPLRLLFVIVDATPAVEREMHQRFARHRLLGEWFANAGELAQFITEQRALWRHR